MSPESFMSPTFKAAPNQNKMVSESDGSVDPSAAPSRKAIVCLLKKSVPSAVLSTLGTCNSVDQRTSPRDTDGRCSYTIPSATVRGETSWDSTTQVRAAASKRQTSSLWSVRGTKHSWISRRYLYVLASVNDNKAEYEHTPQRS